MELMDLQEKIATLYLQHDRKQGIMEIFDHFEEEVGELKEAIIKDDKQNITEEIADVLSFLLEIAKMKGISMADVEKIIEEKLLKNRKGLTENKEEEEREKTIERYLKALVRIGNKQHTDVTATKIQKIFFLLQTEYGKDLGLNFRPWLFGPYSDELNSILDKLIEKGVIKEVAKPIRDPFIGKIIGYKRRYRLKEKIDLREIEPGVRQFFKTWIVKDRKEILEYVFTKYSEYSDYRRVKNSVLGITE